jgi:hypothetical protein
MELNSDDIARITAYLDATTPLPARADLIFVFGSRWLTPAQIAIELYYQGRAPYVMLTGGENRYTGHNEANLHYALLTDSGVPAENVIVENRSTNTLENVTLAIPLIERKLEVSSLHSVLAVCKWMHSKRALMTLKRHFPRGVRYYAYTYEPNGVTRENWYLNPRAESANVLKHWEGIPQYLERQHIEEIIRDGDSYI